jgi:hypothetical protein
MAPHQALTTLHAESEIPTVVALAPASQFDDTANAAHFQA